MNKTSRLLDFFEPDNYKIAISIDNDYQAFTGRATITGQAKRPGDTLVLHLNGPTISQALVNGKEVEATYNKADQQVSLRLQNDLAENQKLAIEFEFAGHLSQTMEGMYRSTYTENDKEKILVSTQFESTHAREVFPCIDEPAAKAVFDLTLETPAVKTVLANTPIKSQAKSGNRLTTVFEASPKMSSYLLAWVIGDLVQKSLKTTSGTEVNVFATSNNADRLDFSLDVAVKTLEYFEDYFGIHYPLQKLDMVAIPEFASGAMENWGLITYRETAMLFDEKNSSLPTKRRVIEVIAHELAHQWFGNLVTMQWWDDLWLNESFATFMSFLCAETIYPELGFDELFMEEEYFPALHADSNSKTTSIYAPLEDPRDINEHFDPAITYGKGAAVLRMLHRYIGDTAFREGLHKYLSSKKYSNAVGQDLWNTLKDSSGKPVDVFMQKWIMQAGYPLVSYEDGKLSQQRFVEDTSQQIKDDTLWPIIVSDDFNLSSSSADIQLNQKINLGQYGVYRTKYSQAFLAKLADTIPNQDWQNTDLMGLLDDASSLSKAGLSETSSLLGLISKYKQLDGNAVWDVVLGSFGSVYAVFGEDPLKPKLDKFAQELVSHQYSRLGWEQPDNESPFDTLLRPSVLALACKHDHGPALDKAKELYYRSLEKSEDLNPNLRSIVYATMAKKGGAKIFDQLLANHNQTDNAEEKRRFAGALCSFEDDSQILRAIELIKTDTVRQQEVISWIFGLFQNRYARKAIWQWQKDNWEWIAENFGRGHLYSYFVMGLATFNSQEDILDIESFYKDKSLVGIKRTLEQSIEKIRIKAAWKARDFQDVSDYLN